MEYCVIEKLLQAWNSIAMCAASVSVQQVTLHSPPHSLPEDPSVTPFSY